MQFTSYECHSISGTVESLLETGETLLEQRLALIFVSCSAEWLVCVLQHAAAAKSLQSSPTLCNPTDGSPPGSPIPGILQARILEWVAISFSNA